MNNDAVDIILHPGICELGDDKWTVFKNRHSELLQYVDHWNADWRRYKEIIRSMKWDYTDGSSELEVLECMWGLWGWAGTGPEFKKLCEQYLKYLNDNTEPDLSNNAFGELVSVLCFNGMSRRMENINQFNIQLQNNTRWRYVRDIVRQSQPTLTGYNHYDMPRSRCPFHM